MPFIILENSLHSCLLCEGKFVSDTAVPYGKFADTPIWGCGYS